MSKTLIDILRIMAIVVGLFVLSVLAFLAFLTLTEFSPALKSSPVIKGKGQPMDAAKREFTMLSWNIGYGGLGKEMDFFYDGGRLVMPRKNQFDRYFDGIKKEILAHDTADFILLQEVDVQSKRSWNYDEFAALSGLLPGFFNMFAQNYGSFYIPFPFNDPIGRVKAGLACYSKLKAASSETHYFPSDRSWPKRLAFLRRCFVILRFQLDNGRELVILNTHNSAYDPAGVWRKKEMSLLDSVMRHEYQLGNYVVAGGDWNSNPRGFNGDLVDSGDPVFRIEPSVEPGFLPGWQFVYDPQLPSNRNVDMAYRKGITKTTIIDFFVVSPNVGVLKVKTMSLGFADSDHNPVMMGIRLK